MEIKIPREVRKYQESIFFGLSLRQFLCSSIAVIVSVAVYFILKDYIGTEGVTWICVFVAFPLASIGFITYHDMPFEAFIVAYVKSEWLMPKHLYFLGENALYESYLQVQLANKKLKKNEILKMKKEERKNKCPIHLRKYIKQKKQD